MNTRYVLTLCTALMVGGILISGSAHALGKADEKTPMTDSWITAKAKIALFAAYRSFGIEPDNDAVKSCSHNNKYYLETGLHRLREIVMERTYSQSNKDLR